MNKYLKKHWINLILFLLFTGFILLSYSLDIESGEKTAKSFFVVLFEMMKILPFAFFIIALIEVWVSDELIIKYLGKDSSAMAYFWALLLAGVSIGGIYVGLPLAQTLHKKGASLKLVFTYLGFVGIVRIPMTIFELSFLGIQFALVRLMVCIPLFLLAGVMLGRYLSKRNYSLKNADQ